MPPNVNGNVNFFDGCNGELVGIIWGLLIVFSIILYLVRVYFEKKRAKEEIR